MAWKDSTVMEQREEFVIQASKEGTNFSMLCEHYGISRETGYKWLSRYREEGSKGLEDRSHARHHQPLASSEEMCAQIIKVRERHTSWGGRKIKDYLEDEGVLEVPSASTITSILRRHGFLSAKVESRSCLNRFEHTAPNHLWQIDFKGNFEIENKTRCHPLTMLDDHSRFSLCLSACSNEQSETVQAHFIRIFKQYGLPGRINADNGSPLGSSSSEVRYTHLSLWLMDLGIRMSYSRPGHPQTNGKVERFHRTLKQELINTRYFRDLSHVQEEFDKWRHIYNVERPHDALGLKPPISRYQPSYRCYPSRIAEYDYTSDCIVKRIDMRGRVFFEGHEEFIGTAFAGRYVGIQPQEEEGRFDVYYRHQKIKEMSLS